MRGQQLSDGCLTTSIVLCDVQLDDIRPNRENKITRFIEKRHLHEDEKSNEFSRSMIDITVTLKQNETFADVKVYSFNLIISIDFLLRISRFFGDMEAKNEPNVKQPVVKSKSPTAQAGNFFINFYFKIVLKISYILVTPQDGNVPVKSLTLNLHIEQPDVILVESLDNLDCYALILNVRFNEF